MENKILGVLYGMAIGDAFGMPPELWSRKKLIQEYGVITDFLDGHYENEVSYQYKKGNFTDDTAQALVILDSLINTNFIVNKKDIAKKLLEWAKKENAFEMNILGPTSKIVLENFEKGEDVKKYSDASLTNGSAMRIAPIGCLFEPKDYKSLCKYVKEISSVTHSSDITIAGACMIAIAVSSAIFYGDKEKMIEDILNLEKYSLSLGKETASPSLGTRIKYGVKLAKKYSNDETLFLNELYNMFGAGVNVVDSVPCAISIAYYSFGDVLKCAKLCANLGGDTDTIGAMATAICGGVFGIEKIPRDVIDLIKNANNVNFENYSKILLKKRNTLNKKCLIIGATILDITLKMDKLPLSGEDVYVNSQSMSIGGCAYNVANIIGHFGINHTLFSPIGNGTYAKIIEEKLLENKFSSEIKSDEMDNGYCLCLVENNGERTFLTIPGIESEFKKEWFSKLNIEDYNSVYVSGYEIEGNGGENIIQFLEENKQLTLFYAPGPRINYISKEKHDRIFKLNPIVHLNEKEILEFTKEKNYIIAVKNLSKLTNNTIIVTLGDKGAFVKSRDEEKLINTVKVKQIDTTGAGDSHIGTIIAIYEKKKSIFEVVEIANKVASEIVCISGATFNSEQFKKGHFENE